jgi:lysophospholipase L1-like esterase
VSGPRVARVCTLTTACTANNIHPDPAGYQLIADTLNAAL